FIVSGHCPIPISTSQQGGSKLKQPSPGIILEAKQKVSQSQCIRSRKEVSGRGGFGNTGFEIRRTSTDIVITFTTILLSMGS
ncbi:unnamed protein product, partial [marine sediment metagenome]